MTDTLIENELAQKRAKLKQIFGSWDGDRNSRKNIPSEVNSSDPANSNSEERKAKVKQVFASWHNQNSNNANTTVPGVSINAPQNIAASVPSNSHTIATRNTATQNNSSSPSDTDPSENDTFEDSSRVNLKALAGLETEREKFDEIHIDDEVDSEEQENSEVVNKNRQVHQNGWVRTLIGVVLTGLVILPIWGVAAFINSLFGGKKQQIVKAPPQQEQNFDIDSQANLLAQAERRNKEREVAQVPLSTPVAPEVTQPQPSPPPPQIQTQIIYRDVPVDDDRDRIQRPNITPEDLYRKASQTGVYGQIRNNPTNSNYNRVYNFSKNTQPKKQTRIISKKKQEVTLPIGLKSKGILLDSIATLDLKSIAHRNFIVKLSEHLKSPSGKIILPAGTQLVTKVTAIHPNGYIKLTPVSLQMISRSTRSLASSIAPHQILINSQNGELLKAEVHRPSTIPGDVLMAIISGFSSGIELINRPESQTFYSNRYGSSSSIKNPNTNLPLSIAGGAAAQLSQRMALRTERQSSRLQAEQPVFILRAGKIVEVYINEAFSL